MSKNEFVDAIDSLFLKLELAYHYQFYKVFGTDQRLNEGKKLWASSLKKFDATTILSSAETVVDNQPYLPTLTDVIRACNDILSLDGFPSVEEAYIEAIAVAQSATTEEFLGISTLSLGPTIADVAFEKSIGSLGTGNPLSAA